MLPCNRAGAARSGLAALVGFRHNGSRGWGDLSRQSRLLATQLAAGHLPLLLRGESCLASHALLPLSPTQGIIESVFPVSAYLRWSLVWSGPVEDWRSSVGGRSGRVEVEPPTREATDGIGLPGLWIRGFDGRSSECGEGPRGRVASAVACSGLHAICISPQNTAPASEIRFETVEASGSRAGILGS